MSKQDQGSSFSVYHKGEPVVDLWGGYADPGSLTLRQEDSIGLFYSSTKAVAAIVLAMLSDRYVISHCGVFMIFIMGFGIFLGFI